MWDVITDPYCSFNMCFAKPLLMLRHGWLYTPLFYMDHDDVIKWKHFPYYWPFVRGIHWSPVDFPFKGMFSLICTWTNDWANNWHIGNLRCHSTRYDITVMMWVLIHILWINWAYLLSVSASKEMNWFPQGQIFSCNQAALQMVFSVCPSVRLSYLFTRGQFWPSGIVVACVCVCVRVSVRQSSACPRSNSSAV